MSKPNYNKKPLNTFNEQVDNYLDIYNNIGGFDKHGINKNNRKSNININIKLLY